MAIQDRTETTRAAGATQKRDAGVDTMKGSATETTRNEAMGDAQDALLDSEVQAAREAAELRRRAHRNGRVSQTGSTSDADPRRPIGPEREPDATEEPDSRVETYDDNDGIVDDGPTITPRKVDLRTSMQARMVGMGPNSEHALADEDDDEEEEADDLVGNPAVPPRVPPRPRDPKPVFGE